MKTIVCKVWVPFLRPAANLGSGILLNMLKKFNSGDFIEIEGEIGSVISKNLLSSQIQTIDGELISIDNSAFFLGSMHNLNKQNIIRLDLKLDVCYSENMPKIKNAIMTFLKSQNGLLSSPKIKISVAKLKDSFVELKISPWCALDNFLSLDDQLETLLRQHLINAGFKISNLESYSEIRGIA
jgi:small-conductance mechanosensitive channel